MWWKFLLLVVLSGVIVAAFVAEPPQQQIGPASRIFYFHVPMAWIAVLAFTMAMVYSVLYLRSRRVANDDRAAVAAALGLVFCLLATISGSVFARVTWGSYWNWDPRETSVFVLLLVYGAYFSLRQAVADPPRRAALASVYAVFAFVTVPFLVFVVPRVLPSLHPSDSIVSSDMKFAMGPTVRIVFFASLVAFTMLYLWMFSLARRVADLARAANVEE